VFGLDLLSSAAYGPEAALTVLLVLGATGIHYIVPLTGAIAALLAIVHFSYRQTIAAYPQGGGSYTVARENLGERAGLLAGAALMIDYILNVAVGISAGVGALVSVYPGLQPHTLALCLAILALLTLVNLRGVREAGALFMFPAFLFVACLLVVVAWCGYQTIAAGGHPRPAIALPRMPPAVMAASVWLLVRSFASGCAAITGVEAVSNGVQYFRELVIDGARRTLTAIVSILIVLLAGIALLTQAYGIGATPPGRTGYQSVLSMLTAAVAGRGRHLWNHHGVRAGSALPFCEHIFRWISATVQHGGQPRLSAAQFRNSWAAAGIFGVHLGTRHSRGGLAAPLRRDYRPPDTIIRRGCFLGLHALAGGDGSPLEDASRAGRAPQYGR
jgi:amino acid transporter